MSGKLISFLLLFVVIPPAEEFFTSRSVVDVKELKENYPNSALVLDVNDENLPNTSDLSYRSIPVHDVEVGSYILVGTGEVCDNSSVSHLLRL